MTSVMNRLVALGVLSTVLGLAGAASAQTMTAGTAKGVITNDASLVMVNGRMSQGTKEDIHARVLVLNDGGTRLVFVTYDLNCLDVATPILRQRVRTELGIDPSRLILLATHNHNAPIQINPDNFVYGHGLAERMFGLIQEAIAAERGPVQVEFGSGHGYFITARGNAPVDYEIQLLKVTHQDAPMAMLFSHGTHPAQASRSMIDAGHPGYAMEEIEGQGPLHAGVHYDEEGKADGYIIYTLRANKVDPATRGQEIIIRDMAWLSMDGYRLMWEWLKRHDLVGRVSYQTAAADDPAVELFAEPRLLHGVDHEGIWLRVVDATGALGDRAYSSEGELTIGLTDDPLTPWNNRSIRLEASPEGAHVTSSKSADLQTSAKALASLYSGFRTARQLRAWGLIEGEDHVIDTADRLFASSHAPHCPDHF